MAGEKISMDFNCAEDAEKFRVALAKYKKIQDTYQIGLGMMDENDTQALRFSLDKKTMVATIAMVDKPDPRQFSFKILTEDVKDEQS